MKMIVGLGNPGNEYINTRHNIGFMTLDNYIKTKNISVYKNKFNGLYIKAKINNEDVIFLKPQMYINLSGVVIKKYIDYFKVNISDILIISDDLDLEIGRYKLKSSGSSGGHNGLKNIELELGTQNYKRLKIGISNNKNIDTKDYVLGKLTESDLKTYTEIFKVTDLIIDEFLFNDFDKIMSKYNHKGALNIWNF